MKYISFLLLLALSYQSFAQCSANDCPCFLKSGDRYTKKKDYKKAIFNYLVARDCDPKLGPTIEKKLTNLFNAIEQQRKDAIKAKEETAKALAQIEKEQAKNQQIINAFYFYEDKFALAYKNNKYGFINKEGKVLIKYKYEEALPFDRVTGFAKVKKKGQDLQYLLDTLGQEYILAENLDELTPKTTALDLSDQNLDSFPAIILEHPQLKILFFQKNYNLATLPDSISKLKNLFFLDLSNNKLTHLPKSFTQLKNLTTLKLKSFNLTKLPDNFGDLENLKVLILSHCKLESLPESFGNLSQLKSLRLSFNRLSYLPKSFVQLHNLTQVSLIMNQLKDLPEGIEQLKNLKELYLWNSLIQKERRTTIEQKIPWCKIFWN
ncbi:MAG: hypothetical protein GY810_18370 [Aureispira sp.]|nr:hypothetical protein [Aureispira sp.]